MVVPSHAEVLMRATRLQQRVRAAIDAGEPGTALAHSLEASSTLAGWGDAECLSLKIWFGQCREELRKKMRERLAAESPPAEAPLEASVATVATKTCKKCGVAIPEEKGRNP